MEEIIFATNNKHKLAELKNMLDMVYDLKCPADYGFSDEIPEDFETLEENALQKAKFIHERFSINCFADDTGLEIEALNGAPGVYSARYAGESCSFEDNIRKVLEQMKNCVNRKAKFRTVICLIFNNKEYFFEGQVKGEIIRNNEGTLGFGYDPVFKPDGYTKTFAEMSMDEKNEISHRALATKKLADFLKNKYE